MAEKQRTVDYMREVRLTSERPNEAVERQRESIRESLERAEEEHKEHTAKNEKEALAEAKQLAKEQDDHEQEKQRPASPAERRRGPITKKQLDKSFATQMREARNHMSPSARVFSKFIHSRPVEITSDIVGSTIARPNALLSGSIAAFAAVTILYFTAKYFGFALSGFETIGAFILGWVIGILYDYFAAMIRGGQR